MENNVSIRINLNAREFEIKGTEEFISKYDEVIQTYLSIIQDANGEDIHNDQHANNGEQTTEKEDGQKDSQKNGITRDDVPSSFGEYFHKLPKSAKDVDKMLLAGYYIQQTNESNTFSTNDASRLLIEQGVKLSNPSQSMKSNLSTKRVFKHQGRFKVSQTGIDYLKSILST